jgi:tight adherence protein C
MLATPDIVAILGFLAIAVFVYGAGVFLGRLQGDRLKQRLAVGAPAGGATAGSNAGQSGSGPGLVYLPELGAGGTGSDDELDHELSRAGWYKPTAKRDFIAMRRFLIIAVMVLTGTAAVLVGPADRDLVLRIVMLGIGGIVMVWAIPRIYLKAVGQQRVKRIRTALPDALDLLTMCLTGGLALPEALAHVSREILFAHPDLSMELLIVQSQSDLRSSEFAFRQFSRRIDAPEVAALSSLITQGQRLGTDVVGSIREYADNMRLRRRQAADERSSKASVKMLFPLTLCLLPSVFIILWGPSVLELWQFLQSFGGAAAVDV